MEKVSLCSGKYTEKGYVQGRAKTGGDVQRGEMFKGGRVEMFTGGLRVAVRPGKTGGDVQREGGEMFKGGQTVCNFGITAKLKLNFTLNHY